MCLENIFLWFQSKSYCEKMPYVCIESTFMKMCSKINSSHYFYNSTKAINVYDIAKGLCIFSTKYLSFDSSYRPNHLLNKSDMIHTERKLYQCSLCVRFSVPLICTKCDINKSVNQYINILLQISSGIILKLYHGTRIFKANSIKYLLFQCTGCDFAFKLCNLIVRYLIKNMLPASL